MNWGRRVKLLTTKPHNLNLIPLTHMVGENGFLYVLDLHTSMVVSMPTHTYVLIK